MQVTSNRLMGPRAWVTAAVAGLVGVTGLAGCGGDPAVTVAPRRQLSAPDVSQTASGSRAEVWPTLGALVGGATAIVVVEPTGNVQVEPGSGGAERFKRNVIDLNIASVVKGSFESGDTLGLIDGIGVAPTEDYPDGQLFAARTRFLLFIREFRYDPDEMTGRWVLLGPEGAYIDLSGGSGSEQLNRTTFSGLQMEPGLNEVDGPLADVPRSLTVDEVCTALVHLGESTGPGC